LLLLRYWMVGEEGVIQNHTQKTRIRALILKKGFGVGELMDEKLSVLWERGKYPFNQTTLYMDDIIEINSLHICLEIIVRFLKEQLNVTEIYLNHDWHEHDGYINSSNKITINDFEEFLTDNISLYKSRDEDTNVCITIYPDNLTFILRYNILEENEDKSYPGIWGDFDLTIDEKYINDIKSLIETSFSKYLLSNAKEYFDKIYAG